MQLLDITILTKQTCTLELETPAILFWIENSGSVQRKEESLQFLAGQFYIVNAMDKITVSALGTCVLFSPSFLYSQTLNRYYYSSDLRDENDNISRRFIRLLKLCLSSHLKKEPDYYIQNQRDMEVLNFLKQHFAISKFETAGLEQEVQSYIQSRLLSDCSLESTASYFGFSPAYFSKWFSSHFEMPFLKYVNYQRIKLAKNRLDVSEDNLLKIALDCGFSSLNSFNREFQRYYHCTPGSYRKKQEEIKNTASFMDVLQILEKEEPSLHKQKQIEVRLPKTPSLYNSTFVNTICSLGNFSAVYKQNNRSEILNALSEFHICYVQIDFTEDIDINTSFKKEQYVLDMLIDNKISPIITFAYRQIRNSDFFTFIKKFLFHFANRYGKDYIKKWFLEIEYNSAFDSSQAKHYARFIKELKNTLHKMDMPVPLLGPQLLISHGGTNLENLLKEKPILDTITLFCAPYSIEKLDQKWMMVPNTSPDYLILQTQKAQNLADIHQYGPVMISKWKDEIYEQSFLNDDVSKAARLCQLLLNAYGKIASLPSPVLFDSLLEPETSRIFAGKSGLIASNNIMKPAGRLYSFFNHLDHYVLYYDEHLLITYDNEKYFQIIAHNAKEISYGDFYDKNPQDLDREELFADQDPLLIRIDLQGNFSGRYVLKNRILSETCGNPLASYQQMSVPDTFIAKSEIHYLQSSSFPGIQSDVIEAKDGHLILDITLQWNETRHMHLIQIFE